jgi:molybdopterin-dependent oxidoreductase-like protein protein
MHIRCPRRIPHVKTRLDWSRVGLGALAGLLTGAVAVGAGQLVAGLTSPGASPVVAVGQLQIDFTPPALKYFAIRAFGSHDKLVLVGGILVVLALFAATLGIVAMRRLRYGLAGLVVFAAIGVTAAATRPAASAADVRPALAAAAAAMIAMPVLVRAARAARPARSTPPPQPSPTLGTPPAVAQQRPSPSQCRCNRTAGASWRSAPSPRARPRRVRWRAAAWPGGSASPAPGRRCVSPHPPSAPRRCPRAPTCGYPASARSSGPAPTSCCAPPPTGSPPTSPCRRSWTAGTHCSPFAMNGTALPVAHGFPARMVVPGLYGYVSACKWLTNIGVTTYQAATAYWAQRGWDAQAPIKTESRIDVPNGNAAITAGPTRVAGVAWAQHKGIDAVEVRADRGAWHQARLAAVPGIDTWRQWVWDWHATPGTHLLQARATDKTGYTQTAAQTPPEPNGATGYPSVTVTVT